MDFPDRCMIEPLLAKDVYGECVYSTPISVKCNYRETSGMNAEGSNIITSAWIAFPPRTVITHDTRVTLLDGQQPAVMAIEPIKLGSCHRIEYIRVLTGKN